MTESGAGRAMYSPFHAPSEQVVGCPPKKEVSQHDSEGDGVREVSEGYSGPACHQDGVTGVTKLRFVVLALFSVYGFIDQVQYTAYTTIINETKYHFNTSAVKVNILTAIVPFVYVLTVLPGCQVYDLIGLRWGMIIGSGCCAVAGCIKFIAVFYPHYSILVVAQILVAFGQVFFLSLPTHVASTWFPVEERTLATAIAALFGFVGMATGMFYSPFVVKLPDKISEFHWCKLFGSQMGIACVVFVLIVMFVRRKPDLPPSVTASEDNNEEDAANIYSMILKQLKNKQLVLLAIVFGAVTGFLTALAAVLAQLAEPFDISEEDAGTMAFAGLMAGSIFCGVVGYHIDRTRKYKKTFRYFIVAITALLLPMSIVVEAVSNDSVIRVFMYIIVSLVELCVLPLIPIAMELSVELTYPDPEIISTSIIILSLSFFSILGIIIFGIIIGDYPSRHRTFAVVLSTTVIMAGCLAGTFFMKEDLRRMRVEQEKAQRENNDAGSAEEVVQSGPPQLDMHV